MTPIVVLIEPQMGANIGAAMRAMCNFGLHRMRLVRPRDGWPNASAVAMATGAGRLLEDVEVFESTELAVGDCHAVYATTARPRGLTKRVLTPEAAMPEILSHSTAGRRVALMFGPERSGLPNADIVLSNAIISIPVDPDFPVLNLAQAVLLVSYEWRRSTHSVQSTQSKQSTQSTQSATTATGTAPRELTEMEAPTLAESIKVTKFVQHLIEELEGVDCFFTGEKKPAMASALENMIRRWPLTEQDVRTLWRVIRTLSTKRGNEEMKEKGDS